MSGRVLLVDDEPHVLDGYRRALRKRVDLATAAGPQAGLEAIAADGPFAVVCADLQMPEMNGIEFLQQVRRLEPDTVRMMLTGQADLRVAMDAVNAGGVFRFLTKPCPADELQAALEVAMEQYRLVTAERELLGQTLQKTARVLVEVVGMLDPQGQAETQRVKAHVAATCDQLGLQNTWEYELAAMLTQLTTVGLPSGLLGRLHRAQGISEAERKMIEKHTRGAYALIAEIPRLDRVAKMVRLVANPPLDGPGSLDESNPEDVVATGAHLIDIGLTYERRVAGGATSCEVLDALQAEASGAGRSRMLEAFADTVRVEVAYRSDRLRAADLRVSMILGENLTTSQGAVLLAKGYEITPSILDRVRTFAEGVGVDEPIEVLVPT